MNSGPTCVALLVGVVAIYLSGRTVYLSAPNYLLEWPDGLKMFGNWMRGIAVYVGWSCLEVAYLGPRHMMGEGLVDGDRPLLT